MKNNTIIKKKTVKEVVSFLNNYRLSGGPDEKKKDIRKVNIPFNVIFPSAADSPYISLGYTERLMRKLEIELSEDFDSLEIKNYREGCGYFTGSVKVTVKGKLLEFNFQWEGKGAIEDTWNLFTIWSQVS